MPEFASERSGERGRVVKREPAKETPEQAATTRVDLLWHDADSVKQRGAKLSGVVVRQEWRAEREALQAKHQGLEKELAARAVDAEASERARERYKDAAGKVQALGEELEHAKEPRPKPPVRDEVELEPSIIDRSLPPEQVLAWVAGLDKRERRAVEDRVVAMGSADRDDGFAVALSNYFGSPGVRKAYEAWAKATGLKAGPGQPTLRDRFLAVARDPRHWRAAGGPNAATAPASASAPSSHEVDGSSGGAPSSHEADGSSGGAAPAPSLSSPNVASSGTPVASSAHATPAMHATPAAHAMLPTTAHRSALERALALTQLGAAHLEAIRTELVPAYRRAVAAMDTAAVKALALQIVGGVARIVDAQAHVVRLVPLVDTSPHAARASTAETDAGVPDPAELAALTAEKAALDGAVATIVPTLAVQVSPQWFGDEIVVGRAVEPAPHVREVLVQLAYEAGLVVQLLEDADVIEALIRPIDKVRGTSEQGTEGARRDAVAHCERWKGRPINFLFLTRVLTRRGLWQLMQGVQDAHGDTAAELERKVGAQARETGTTADVGDSWDAEEAHRLLSYGKLDWKITDAEASRVLEMLAKAEPRARGELVKELYRMGRLAALCEHLPWGQVKELWESIPDPEASKLLEPYWADKGGGKSLGKRLEDQDHWYTTALSRFLDVATFGAKPRIDAAYDAREAGLITNDDYWGSVTKAVGRAAFVAAATAATGGVAGELVTGASEGMGLMAAGRGVTGYITRGATTVASSATAGGLGNVAGHFVGDLYDQTLEGKEGFDSLSSYGESFGEGVKLGAATGVVAAVGLSASKFIQGAMRTVAQEAAAAHPQLTRVLEAARSVGVRAGARVRMTVEEFLKTISGGPRGLRLAYAGAPVPSSIGTASRNAPLWVTVRPLQDLNAPMQSANNFSDHIAIDSVKLFDDYGEGGEDASYKDEDEAPGALHEDDARPEFDDGYGTKTEHQLALERTDPRRPLWQESELKTSGDLDWADFRGQRSFGGGKEVRRGAAGSTRPDNYSESLRMSVDVKNYEIVTREGRAKLVKDIVQQMAKRARHLPKGSRQGVVIDVRGQGVSASKLTELRARIVRDAGGRVAPDDIVFLTE
jgi:hypothetical protein